MAGLVNLVRGESASALDLHEPCCIEEENVTQGSEGIVSDPDIPLDKSSSDIHDFHWKESPDSLQTGFLSGQMPHDLLLLDVRPSNLHS